MNKNEDIKIICEDDCGNAPKKVLIRDYEIAMIKKDEGYLLNNLTEDCVWQIIGADSVQGRENVLSLMNEKLYDKVLELKIDTINTHGISGSSNGTMKFERRNLAFCNVYKFSSFKNAKIKVITSYWIDVN